MGKNGQNAEGRRDRDGGCFAAHTERPCIIVRASSLDVPEGEGERERVIYVRSRTTIAPPHACTHARTHVGTCWRINRTFAFPSSTSPTPALFASPSSRGCPLADACIPPVIGGCWRVACCETGNIWWPSMVVRFPFFPVFPLFLFYFFPFYF